jgi:hypothetical protein
MHKDEDMIFENILEKIIYLFFTFILILYFLFISSLSMSGLDYSKLI